MKIRVTYFSISLLVLVSLVLLVIAGINIYEVLTKGTTGLLPEGPSSQIGATNIPNQAKGLDQKKERRTSNYTENIWRPANERLREFLEPVKEKWEIRFTGVILEAGKPPVAFISVAGNERICAEGDRIGPWKIERIEKNQVILVNNSTGEKKVLKLEKGDDRSRREEQIKNLSKEDWMSQLQKQLAQAAHLDRDQLMTQVKSFIKMVPEETIYQMIEEITGISPEEISPDTNLSEYVTDLIQISRDGILPEKAPTTMELITISFSLQVNPDNSAQNPVTSFAETDKRIYACFPNQGALQGLKNVITRWTNLSTGGPIVYLDTKPINPATLYNFVWVQKQKSWSKGLYQVELFKIGTLTKMAQGRFEIE